MFSSKSSYAAAGVDLKQADQGLAALASVLATIDSNRPTLNRAPAGHYAAVIEVAENLGVAIGTDGVGTKIVLAQQLQKFDTVGIDCIAMNVNDLICLGARPLAVVDYLAVEEASEELLAAVAQGLKRGAELADVEIPGGELAQVKELIKGHPSPYGFDLVGTSIGTVQLDKMISGEAIEPGDALIGLPSSGVHSNGLTLARDALFNRGGLELDERPATLSCTVGEELLKPTEIYVKAVMELVDSDLRVNGLAHITGGGLRNLLRLKSSIGYRVSNPLPVPPIFDLIAECGSIEREEMYEVFNMGVGFCVVINKEDSGSALALLQERYPEAKQIGEATSAAGTVGY